MSNQYRRMNNDHTKPEEQYAFFEAEVVEPVAQPNNKPYGPLAPGNYNNYGTPPPPVNYNNPAYNNNAPPGYSNDYYNNYQPAPGQDVQYPPPITQPYPPLPRSPPRPTGTTPPPPYLPPTQYQAPVPPASQQPPYNPAYSSSTYPTNSHLTQPYTRPTMLPHQPYTPPPVPPIHSDSHSRYNTSSSSSSPLTNSRPPPTNSRPPPPPITAAPVYGAKSSGRRRHGRDEDCCEDCCDCCTVCGCFRFACTLVTIIFGILFIIGGLSLITFSNTLPGKCQGVCDPNGNNGTYVPTQVPSIGNETVSSVNNTTSDLAGQCSNLCSKGVFDGLHYSGIAMLIIGAIIIGCQLLNMLCRSGGRGSGCCFCC